MVAAEDSVGELVLGVPPAETLSSFVGLLVGTLVSGGFTGSIGSLGCAFPILDALPIFFFSAFWPILDAFAVVLDAFAIVPGAPLVALDILAALVAPTFGVLLSRLASF